MKSGARASGYAEGEEDLENLSSAGDKLHLN
jgi:hypothetical protein